MTIRIGYRVYCFASALLVSLAFINSPAASAAEPREPISVQSLLLHRAIDRDALARQARTPHIPADKPAAATGLASSPDKPGWFANADFSWSRGAGKRTTAAGNG